VIPLFLSFVSLHVKTFAFHHHQTKTKSKTKTKIKKKVKGLFRDRQSLMNFVQRIGRGERKKKGSEEGTEEGIRRRDQKKESEEGIRRRDQKKGSEGEPFADELEKLCACSRVLSKDSQHRACHCGTARLLRSSHRHAHVRCFHHHRDAEGLQNTFDPFCDLFVSFLSLSLFLLFDVLI